MYGVAGALIGAGLLIAYYTGVWTSNIVLFLGVIIVFGAVLLSLSRTAFISRVQKQLDQQSNEFSQSKDLDDLWEDLQEWMKDDPRDTEIVWRTSETFPTLLPLPIHDPMFWLYSIKTPKKDTDEALHIVVEATTGVIVHNAPIDDDYEFDAESPFENVPLVQQYRLSMMMDVMERRDLKQKIESFALGKLPGGYDVTSLDKQTEQLLKEVRDGQRPRPPRDDATDRGTGEPVEGDRDAARRD
jgi:hypothetical protein